MENNTPARQLQQTKTVLPITTSLVPGKWRKETLEKHCWDTCQKGEITSTMKNRRTKISAINKTRKLRWTQTQIWIQTFNVCIIINKTQQLQESPHTTMYDRIGPYLQNSFNIPVEAGHKF